MLSLTRHLARRRVTLGFVFAIGVLYFARPTPHSLALGAVVGLVGEAIRIWAAGHLEKSREVTASGPYRFTRHPLYLGSSIMALGVLIASRSLIVAVVVIVYMAVTISSAIVTEERFLRRTFGTTYDEYKRAQAEPVARRFSLARARRNREHRAIAGLAAGFAILALKIALSI